MSEKPTPSTTVDAPPTGLSAPAGSVFLDCGGPNCKISVNGQIIEFEDHPYCGPTKLTKRGDPAAHQPPEFLMAASLWCQQGKQIEDGLCRWNHEQEPILKRINSRSAIVIGWKPAQRGQ
jgi:hypothetical protein